MPLRLDISTSDFEQRFLDLLAMKRESDSDVDAAVATILDDVRINGDQAVFDLTEKYDGFKLPEGFCFTPEEIDAAIKTIPQDERTALEMAAERIRAYHKEQLPEDKSWQGPHGETLGWRFRPVSAAGLYVPGGLASYPSSVLMNAIPAHTAGVEDLIICAPTPKGAFNPLVLYAARLSGVERIYRVGGAQAIGAMAYGTQSIPKVDVITGPGNAYVAAAKRRVYGTVGIDMIAGPSEVLVIADKHNDPDWIALDLLSQAEHDEAAQSILITNDQDFADAVEQAVEKRLQTLERRKIAGASWRDFGAVIVVKTWDQAIELTDRLAPEHLEICTENCDALAEQINHAGAIFIGPYSPEAIGDYIAGPNHVLPTSRSARFASGLSVFDFIKRTTVQKMTPAALSAIGPSAEILAKSENLEAHGLSVRARLDKLNDKTSS